MGVRDKLQRVLKRFGVIYIETRVFYRGREHNESNSKVCLECLLIDTPQAKKLSSIGNSKGVLLPLEWREVMLGKDFAETGDVMTYFLSLPKGEKVVLISNSSFNLEVGA